MFVRLTGSLPEDTLPGLACGPWGVAYRQLALCSAAVVLQIWVKYPAGTEFINGLVIPALKKSGFTAGKTFFCEQATPTAPLPDAGETPLGIRIIFSTDEIQLRAAKSVKCEIGLLEDSKKLRLEVFSAIFHLLK